MSAVSVLIPSLRGGGRLVTLAEQLTGAGAEVWVADNGMLEQDAADLARAGATVRAMGTNLGFGRAVNALAADARGRTLVVLNDDIEAPAGFLEALVAGIGDAAMASGVLLKAEQPCLIESAGVVIDRCLGAYDYLQDLSVDVLATAPAPLGPTGGAAAFRRDAFERAGGYDEGFFAYFEDVDLALRLRMAGKRCVLAGDARALHVGSATLGYDSLAKAAMVGASRGRLVRKYGLLRAPTTAAWVLATESLTALELARRHRSPAPARARVDGYRECDVRAPRPARELATVTLRDGLRRRHVRSRRETLA